MKHWKMRCLTSEKKVWSSRLQWTLVSHLIYHASHSKYLNSFLGSRYRFPFYICNCSWWSCHVRGILLPLLRNYKLTTWCHASSPLYDPSVFHLPWHQTSAMWEISEICPVWVPVWNIALSPEKQSSFVLAPRKQIPEEFVLRMLASC